MGEWNPCAPIDYGAKLCDRLLADALLFRLFVTGNVSGHDVMKQNSKRDVKEKLIAFYFGGALGVFARDVF